MKTIYILIVVNWLLLFGVTAAGQENLRYYEIRVQDRVVGYIECQPTQSAVNQGRQAEERTTVTVVKAQSEDQPVPQNIAEKHVNQAGTSKLLFYSLEYHEGDAWEQQVYVFGNDSVTMSVLHNNNKVKEVTVGLPPKTHIVTDYFSLLPLLATIKKHPLTISVVDIKRITPQHSQAPVQTITLQPSGDRLYSAQGQTTLCHTFAMKWDDGTTLHFWLSSVDHSLLRIEDVKSKTVVTISNSEVKNRLNESKPRMQRTGKPLPFVLGKQYLYTFYFDGKPWGTLQFSIEHKTTPHAHYLVAAQGNMQTLRNSFSFTSETVYGMDFKVIAYRIREGENTEIQCDFTAQGVKERYRRQQSILERFVPIQGDFVFLDNNGIHHFAMFMTQFPAELPAPLSLPIFHPRRMAASESIFTVQQKQGEQFVVAVETPYYNMQMTITQDGKLVRYVQGKLEVVLSEKKD